MESPYPANQIAKPKTCCNFGLVGKYELAKKALIKSSNMPTTTFIAFKTFISAFAPASTFVIGLLGIFTDIDLQNATRLVVKSLV